MSKHNVDKARTWMQTQLLISVRELEVKFAGANITVLVSMPGCGRSPNVLTVHKPEFSHATTAVPEDLRACLGALIEEMTQ
jgi:hypothetical protein